MTKVLDKEVERAAMAIVNYTNETNEVDVETRQKNNDKCIDYATVKIKELNRPRD